MNEATTKDDDSFNHVVTCRPIGYVSSPYSETVGVPIQTAGAPQEAASLRVLPEFTAGLRDLADFEFIILITHLHLVRQERLEVTPFLDNTSHGVFATRAPARPNRMGLSIVRLKKIEGNVLHFTGNDMIDGTPVLDIKPYVPHFDVRQTERIGWFAKHVDKTSETRSDKRMD